MSLIASYFKRSSEIVDREYDTENMSEFQRDCLIVTERYKGMSCSLPPHQAVQAVRNLNEFLRSVNFSN